MVTAHYEVRSAMVLADDGVPDCFSWSAHAHGEREQAEYSHAVGVARKQGLVDTHPGEVVDVAWFGQADNRVDEDISLARPGSADGQFSMGSVHGIASLKGNDARPAEFLEVDSEFGWSIAQSDVVVVVQSRDGVDLAPYVEILDCVVQVFDRWMLRIPTEYILGLLLSVPYQRQPTKKQIHTD